MMSSLQSLRLPLVTDAPSPELRRAWCLHVGLCIDGGLYSPGADNAAPFAALEDFQVRFHAQNRGDANGVIVHMAESLTMLTALTKLTLKQTRCVLDEATLPFPPQLRERHLQCMVLRNIWSADRSVTPDSLTRLIKLALHKRRGALQVLACWHLPELQDLCVHDVPDSQTCWVQRMSFAHVLPKPHASRWPALRTLAVDFLALRTWEQPTLVGLARLLQWVSAAQMTLQWAIPGTGRGDSKRARMCMRFNCVHEGRKRCLLIPDT